MRLLTTTLVLFIMVFAISGNSYSDNLYISNIEFYKINNGKEEKFIKFYDVVDSRYIDIVVEVGNDSSYCTNNVKLILSVSPKIGNIIYNQEIPDEYVYDEISTQKTAGYLCALYNNSKKIKKILSNKKKKITFRFDLYKFTHEFKSRQLWVTELNFKVSIIPQKKESNLMDNTKEMILVIPMPAS